MATKNASGSSEILQIVILTLFITSGFLALACLVFSFLVPGQRERAERQAADVKDLVTRLADQEVKRVRDEFNRFAAENAEIDFKQIIFDNLLNLESKITNFHKTGEKRSKGTVVYTQKLSFSDAYLQDVIDFIGRVRQKHRAIRVTDFDASTRGGRRSFSSGSDEEDPKWSGDVTFVLHRNEEVLKKYLPRAGTKKRPPAAGADTAAAPVDASPPVATR